MPGSSSLRILATEGGGQLGRSLRDLTPTSTCEWIICDRAELDISDVARVTEWLSEAQPAVVVNAAAYTDVEQAEQDPEAALRVVCDQSGSPTWPV